MVPPTRDDRRNPARQQRRRPGRRLSDLTDPENPGFVRVSEVARYFDVDRRTVEKWSAAGHLPIRPFPDVDRIALADIVAFVEKHQVKPRPASRSPRTEAPDRAQPDSA